MPTILTETDEYTVPATNGLHLSAADAARVTGWTLKPEGMCKDDLCVPMPVQNGMIDIAAFWQKLGNPVASSAQHDVWSLGTGAATRTASLAGLQAPDFELSDLAGKPHRLSDLRGKKILLTTWASW